MIWKDPGRSDFANSSEGFWRSSGAGVEPTGSQRRMDQVAGKEIACEQKVMFETIESAMARGVGRKGNNL